MDEKQNNDAEPKRMWNKISGEKEKSKRIKVLG
jgi:hypothetical protein